MIVVEFSWYSSKPAIDGNSQTTSLTMLAYCVQCNIIFLAVCASASFFIKCDVDVGYQVRCVTFPHPDLLGHIWNGAVPYSYASLRSVELEMIFWGHPGVGSSRFPFRIFQLGLGRFMGLSFSRVNLAEAKSLEEMFLTMKEGLLKMTCLLNITCLR